MFRLLQNKSSVFNIVFIAIFLGVLILQPWSEAAHVAFFDCAAIVSAGLSAVLGVLYARGNPKTSAGYSGWILLSLSGFAYSIGQCIWTYYEVVLKIEAPFPSWADAGYLVSELLFIISVFVLFSSRPVLGRMRLLMDSAIAMTSVGALSWYLIMGKLWDQSSTSLLGKLIGVAYPCMDAIALYGVVVLYYSTRHKSAMQRSIALVVAGITSIVLADSCYLYYSLNGTYQTGTWLEPGWTFGWLLCANALWVQLKTGPERNDEPAFDEIAVRGSIAVASTAVASTVVNSTLASSTFVTALRLLAPYVLSSVALASITAYDLKHYGRVSLSIVAWECFLVALVVVRQVLTIIENHHLTQQVTSLLNFNKAVNNTLHVGNVLSVAADHARQMLGGHGAMVWLHLPEEHHAPELFRSGLFNDTSPLSQQCCGAELGEFTRALNAVAAHKADSNSETVAISGDIAHNAASVQDCLYAPLLRHGRPVGMMAVVRRSGHFKSSARNLLESISMEVGTAVTNAMSYRDAVEAADQDPVTGLLNHRAIHQRFKSEFERASATASPLSIIMMDLNDFKFFNDTYGHPIGDQVLQSVARTLQSVQRDTDILGRYGGDEFIAILPDTDAEGGRCFAERLRALMARNGFSRNVNLEGASCGISIPITLSCGVASFPSDSNNYHELITMADANLYQAKLSKGGIETTSEVRRSRGQLRTSGGSFEFLEGLVTAVDNKDSYTRRHSEDVTEFALWIAEELGFSEDAMYTIRVGGLLHDVGKIGVPDGILRKPGSLTNEEFEVVKRHPVLGALIVSGIPDMAPIVDIVRSHHERWDGKGYPDQLSGEDIPLLGRLMAVADAFSAMTTTRPYRLAMSWEVAMHEIEAGSGKQFDPQMAQAFLRVARQRRNTQPADRARED
jgi:diguanylate cyclase (GGDEF)-like protein/putative nucleotidyltransferase with HDIG domain